MALQFTEDGFKNLFTIILSQAKIIWIAPSEMESKVKSILYQNDIVGLSLPYIYDYKGDYYSYINDLWELYKRKYFFASSPENISSTFSINDIITLGDVKSEIDVKNKAGQLIAQIQQVDSRILSALKKSDTLKKKAKEHHEAGWSWGGKDKRLAIEALQSVTRDMADAQEEIIGIQQDIVAGQKMLNQHTTILYQLGAMSLAANRMVHRELKMKFEHASREELSDLARQELLNTILQIEQMQDTLILQEKQKTQLSQHANKISQLEKDNIKLRSDMSESDNRFSNQSDLHNRKIAAIDSACKNLHETIKQYEEKTSDDILLIKKDISQQITKLQSLLNQQDKTFLSRLKKESDLLSAEITNLSQRCIELRSLLDQRDKAVLSRLKKDFDHLSAEITKIDSKYESLAESQKSMNAVFQVDLDKLSANISSLSAMYQSADNSIKEEIALLKKNTYSKSTIWIIVTLSVVLSVILSIICGIYSSAV